MRIESLNFNNLMDAFSCVRRIPHWHDLSREIDQSVNWLQFALQHDFRGKLVFEGDISVGHIFYSPLSLTPVPLTSAHNLVYLRCFYVDPMHRNRGVGSSLIAAMRADCGNYDGALLSASKQDTDMHYIQFETVGFKVVAEQSDLVHMFLPIRKDSIEFRIVSRKQKTYRNKVQVTLFNEDFCPLRNQQASMVRKAANMFGDSIELREVDLTPETAKLYGSGAAFMIDDERSFSVSSSMDDIVSKIETAIARKSP